MGVGLGLSWAIQSKKPMLAWSPLALDKGNLLEL